LVLIQYKILIGLLKEMLMRSLRVTSLPLATLAASVMLLGGNRVYADTSSEPGNHKVYFTAPAPEEIANILFPPRYRGAKPAQSDESKDPPKLTKAVARSPRRSPNKRASGVENDSSARKNLPIEAPVKLLFPLCAFLFPVTFIIIGFPIYEQLSESGFLG
jgi:hypothetical protein